MKYTSLFTVLLLACTSNLAHAALDTSVGVGAEMFSWEEYDQGGARIVDESGPRLTLSLNLTQRLPEEEGLFFAYKGQFYVGKVDYDGSTWGGAAINSKTKYLGMSNEGQALYRFNYREGQLDYILGLGLDSWKRTLKSDQIEDFRVYFMRLGFHYGKANESGFHGGAGFKIASRVKENAHLTMMGFSANPEIRPGSRLNFYTELGYKVPNTKWDIIGYYDNYRFTVSDPVIVNDAAGKPNKLVQPDSSMDVFGVKMMQNF